MGDSLSWLKHLLCTQKIKGSTPLSSTQDCLKFSQGIGLPQGLLNCLENSGDGWLMRITHGAVVTTANTVDLQSVNEGSIPFCSTYLPKGENNGCTHAVIAQSTHGVDFIRMLPSGQRRWSPKPFRKVRGFESYHTC